RRADRTREQLGSRSTRERDRRNRDANRRVFVDCRLRPRDESLRSLFWASEIAFAGERAARALRLSGVADKQFRPSAAWDRAVARLSAGRESSRPTTPKRRARARFRHP